VFWISVRGPTIGKVSIQRYWPISLLLTTSTRSIDSATIYCLKSSVHNLCHFTVPNHIIYHFSPWFTIKKIFCLVHLTSNLALYSPHCNHSALFKMQTWLYQHTTTALLKTIWRLHCSFNKIWSLHCLPFQFHSISYLM
jgi:hypothetical protein